MKCYVCRCACLGAVYLACSIASLLDQLSDVVYVLRDVWHLGAVVLQSVQFFQQERKGLPKSLN